MVGYYDIGTAIDVLEVLECMQEKYPDSILLWVQPDSEEGRVTKLTFDELVDYFVEVDREYGVNLDKTSEMCKYEIGTRLTVWTMKEEELERAARIASDIEEKSIFR